ncbi:formyltetrahydrofolate deformylase [Flocculibacter collagenilyticus]|uniref:formyltetrahydrofolate deformylase n=1 Tax=Flocculibacter collagenilyticus TaxID=2744479 RepID=UPI0018F52401|nr:formyltetrahydrofolate deformylase [Flocculibacter collagenilyticus]
MKNTYRLTISCPDQVGLVSVVSQFLSDRDASIVEASHHTDLENNWFFMRHELCANSISTDLVSLQTDFKTLADKYDMKWSLNCSSVKQKVLLLASKEDHCIADLLHRWHCNELDCEIVGLVANHKEVEKFAQWYNIPFHFVDFNVADKSQSFEQVESLIEQYKADTIVLARFMQIIPNDFCARYSGRIINIHHSFLPSFIGAKPYHQAYNRGVKLIGATCHYVTAELDAGPIIEQEVMRITHSDSVHDMVRKGKDCEKAALSRGLRNHLQDRVIIHQNKTVVFD